MQNSFKRAFPLMTAALAGLLLYGYSDSNPAGVLLADNWKSGQAGALTPGDAVSVNADLNAPDSKELVLKCPNGVFSYKCPQSGCKIAACSATATGVDVHRLDKESETEASGKSSFLFSLLRRAPTATVSTVVRGEANPNDAIVMLKGNEVHLAPALNRILEGSYCFSLQSLESSGATPVTAKLAWNKEDEPEGVVKLPGLQPGAYVLEKKILESSGTCSSDPNAVPAWVILAPENQLADLTTKWKANRAWFDELAASGNSPAVVATMRHTTIAELSQSVKR